MAYLITTKPLDLGEDNYIHRKPPTVYPIIPKKDDLHILYIPRNVQKIVRNNSKIATITCIFFACLALVSDGWGWKGVFFTLTLILGGIGVCCSKLHERKAFLQKVADEKDAKARKIILEQVAFAEWQVAHKWINFNYNGKNASHAVRGTTIKLLVKGDALAFRFGKKTPLSPLTLEGKFSTKEKIKMLTESFVLTESYRSRSVKREYHFQKIKEIYRKWQLWSIEVHAGRLYKTAESYFRLVSVSYADEEHIFWQLCLSKTTICANFVDIELFQLVPQNLYQVDDFKKYLLGQIKKQGFTSLAEWSGFLNSCKLMSINFNNLYCKPTVFVMPNDIVYPSQIDPQKELSMFMWGVTLVAFNGKCDEHAEIIIEGVDGNSGKYFMTLLHFTGSEVEMYPVHQSLKYKARTELYRRSAFKVSKMLENAIKEIEAQKNVKKAIEFSCYGESSLLSCGKQNCFDWARRKLEEVEIYFEFSTIEKVLRLVVARTTSVAKIANLNYGKKTLQSK